MKVIFLGTNGWYDTDTGNTICTLINSEKYHIILDAGNGIYKADRYIHDDLPVYLFLSHFHLDHIEGLHVLNKFRFSQGLRIFGQKGHQTGSGDNRKRALHSSFDQAALWRRGPRAFRRALQASLPLGVQVPGPRLSMHGLPLRS